MIGVKVLWGIELIICENCFHCLVEKKVRKVRLEL